MSENKKSLAKNAILNAIKQVCSIIFPMITFPYAARVIGVENYGKIGFSSSIVNYATLIAALGISNYAIREGARIRNDSHKFHNFVSEVFTINVISTVIAYSLLVAACIGISKLKKYDLLIAISSLMIVCNTLGRDWINSIYEDYQYITIRYIISQTIAVILMFVFVRSRSDLYLYAFTSISGVLIANLMNVFHIYKTYGIELSLSSVSKCKRHMKSIFLLFGTAVALQIYVNSDVTIIGLFLGDSDVGSYSAAVKVYTLVKSLINALLLVAVPRFSYELSVGREKEVNDKLMIILNFLIMVLLPAMMGLILFAPQVIVLVAGNEYLEGYTSLRLLGVSLIFACLACFYIHVIMLPRKMEKKILYVSVISALVNIILNLFFVPLLGINAAAITTAISELIMLAYGIYSTRNIFRYNNIKGLLIGVAGIGIVVLTYSIVRIFINESVLQLFVAIPISGFFYLGIVYIFNKDAMKILLNSKE